MSKLKSICIIDDDKVYTFGVKKLLKSIRPDHTLKTFENGREALDGIKNMIESGKELPDLILLDIDMPEMNGWDFLSEFDSIRADVGKEIEVFVISSRINNKNQELYRVEWDEKVADFIRKPVEASELEKILN